MHTQIKRGFLAGIGLLSMTREKAHKIVDELVKKGEIHRDEIESLIEDIVQRGEEERQAVRNLVQEEVTHSIEEMGLATRNDIQELKDEIRKLAKS